MKGFLIGGAFAALAFAAVPASAATVVDGKCVSVSDSAGCLFSGNINSSSSGNNSYVGAQNAYNSYNDTHSSANPDIFLNVIVSSDDANFASFGSITGAGTASGTWTLGGYAVDYVAVKAADNFVLYKLPAAISSGNWNTFDIPFGNNPHDLSHLVFFGSPLTGGVPEPATWAMMIAGFGLVGGTMRRRTTKVAFA